MTELPFYEELNLIKNDHAFKRYSQSFRVETFDRKDPIRQLSASKSEIKDLFNDLLDKRKVLITRSL